ncbi:MAG: 30S ribosomal protein S15 [Bacilli bacterium]|nr:30S ribosomal protein S15 [Bacilli bacterium]
MALTSEEKKKIVQENKNNVGCTETQIALLSARMKKLLEHGQKHKKDFSASRCLSKLSSRRKKFLGYLKRKNKESYNKIIKEDKKLKKGNKVV